MAHTRLKKNREYTPAYKEQLFFIWYKAGRPEVPYLMSISPPDDSNNLPNTLVVHSWMKLYSWNERADILDAEVARLVEQKAIEEKVEMFQRHAELGKDMQQQATDYFIQHPLDDPQVAIRMLTSGINIEKASKGLPEALLKVAKMKDEELGSVVARLMSKASTSDFEASIEENLNVEDNVVEGEFLDDGGADVENGTN